jgi:lipid-A-disaccharide synthase
VPELIQDDATPEAMAAAVGPLLAAGQAAPAQLQVFDDIHQSLRRDYAALAAAALAQLAGEGSGRPVPG